MKRQASVHQPANRGHGTCRKTQSHLGVPLQSCISRECVRTPARKRPPRNALETFPRRFVPLHINLSCTCVRTTTGKPEPPGSTEGPVSPGCTAAIIYFPRLRPYASPKTAAAKRLANQKMAAAARPGPQKSRRKAPREFFLPVGAPQRPFFFPLCYSPQNFSHPCTRAFIPARSSTPRAKPFLTSSSGTYMSYFSNTGISFG